MESKYIEDIFKDYLTTKDTSYAILINGTWGSGKTYFWKNTLTKHCETVKLKPIYLSLNGINKIETLDYQLKIKLIPYLNKIDVKKAGAIGKITKNIFNKLAEKYGNFNPEDILKDVEIDLSLFSNNVVCFDDLERCKIPLSEVLGYINDFVEHKKLKVVLLSDESKINGSTDENYNSIKEKVIGRILTFKNNLIDTLPFIFEKYKTDDVEFYTFLQSKKEYIYDLLLEYKEENLRNIAFYIDNFSKVFPILKSHNDYSHEILLFSLIITIEFKTGKLTSNDYKDFKGYDSIDSFFSVFDFSKPEKQNSIWNNSKDEVENPKTDIEVFHEKYLTNNVDKYFFYESIYQFVLTGYLDKVKLTDELKSRYPEEIPNEIIVFRKVLNHGFRQLPNNEFKELAKHVFEYTKNGKYGIYDYLQISRWLNFFSKNKLIDLTIEEIHESIKLGIEISKQREETNKRVYDSIFHYKEKDDDTFVYDLIKEAHETIEAKKDNVKVNKLILALNDNNNDSINETFKEYQIRKELFEHLKSDVLFDTLKIIENTTLTAFILELESRYNFSDAKDYLSNDFGFLEELKTYINEYLKDKTEHNVQDFLLIELSEKITKICKKIR
ncbi:hypothetical protein BZL53_01410 [Flavobacterium columnare]|uniref:P-loop NTPase fold protein n=1 Tax=Flavobacterium columnare TaxID=996 RepID=UPI0009821FD3|nr:P-loop NTPase fold protein [Flavobacterium columnare]OOB83768.1 hypothetical protein BZL53_01410 [Flavobacterium columnare]